MEEIKITYESLFNILRKEKNTEELQQLDEDFFENVVDYLKKKEQIISDPNTIEKEKEHTRLQLKNIIKIIRDLYERREKKIIDMAVFKSRGLRIDDNQFKLKEEKMLFEDIYKVLSHFRNSVLYKVIKSEIPKREKNEKETTEVSEKEEDRKEGKMPEDKEEKPTETGMTKIRFITNVPRFAGRNNNIFGPYKPEDKDELPSEIADILIKKQRAVKE
ncbi:hypothetical protein JW949_02555 [Candidatus Woesearchaeota archaeon]|nr:hypothetical protein [Candidatus Woesearchaeota archaeon]